MNKGLSVQVAGFLIMACPEKKAPAPVPAAGPGAVGNKGGIQLTRG